MVIPSAVQGILITSSSLPSPTTHTGQVRVHTFKLEIRYPNQLCKYTYGTLKEYLDHICLKLFIGYNHVKIYIRVFMDDKTARNIETIYIYKKAHKCVKLVFYV